MSIQGSRIHLRQLSKQFQQTPVLQQIDLDIQAGEFIAIVGRSGCGKSTLLRLLAGLEQSSSGLLSIDGKALGEVGQTRLMFQDDRLLPWKTVLDNVGLGLKGAWQDRARQVLAEVGLSEKAKAWPAQLSGGQRQRVALARALIHQPHLLLLDEPLGALDALTRLEMQSLIERIWQEHQFTVVLVTHDVPEAVQLADRVLVLEAGQVALDLPITLTRSRDMASPEAVQYSAQILQKILRPTSVTGLHQSRLAS
ncbi:ATP-binding cassette domain-containing protein [uncultured Thiothrix sp.]|uniref:ATP-binding cassette domain-containing protein n=1 Tax=uncultured Thiothrix sp. TaxID=223185 RepID=UPI00261CDFEC|nr:ATP-binding cassette domain-containing protein [uncultured Thiothrix sp.]